MPGQTDVRVPDPSTTAVVVLGASEWPNARLFEPAPQFANSAHEFIEYICAANGFNLKEAHLLNLFDSDDEQPVIVRKIADFLLQLRRKLSNSGQNLADVITFYVGHGGFDIGSNSTYFLAIRKTSAPDYLGSSLSAASLRRALREHAGNARHYLILDCCFAAAAATAYLQMSNAAQGAIAQIQESFPPSGTALLCAAGALIPAKAKRDAKYTMFSEGLFEVLTQGAPTAAERLTIGDVARMIRDHLRIKYEDEAVRPEVHSPEQAKGNVADVPLFRNADATILGLNLPDPGDLVATVKAVANDATRVHQWLNKFVRESHVGKSGYAIKDRLKSWESIQAAVQRKKEEDPKYSPETVTDASGIRLVTLFQADLPGTLNEFIELIDTADQGAGGGFETDPIDHVLIYSSRDENDPLSIDKPVVRVLEAAGLKHKLRGRLPSSYSSIHVIINAWADFNKLRAHSKVEVQLRSVFEDAWSEINNRLDYAPKRGALPIDATHGGVEPQNVAGVPGSQHLCALKSLVDSCAQFAELIRRQYLGPLDGSPGLERRPQPADRTVETAASFGDCNELVRDAVNTALRARDEAQKIPITDNQRRGRAFGDAANAFEFARSLLESNPPADRSSYQVLDRRLRALSAYCLMLTEKVELVNRAEKILRPLLDEEKDDPVPCYRLGQILQKESKFAEANELFEDGVRRLRKSNLSADHWLRSSLPRSLGYNNWNLATLEADDHKKRALLEKALRFTGQALQAARTEQHENVARNNIIYFILDLMPLVDNKSQLLSALKEHFEVLNKHADLEKESWLRLDTLMRAAYHIGELRLAKIVAERLMEYFDKRMFGDEEKAGWREKIPSERELSTLSSVETDVYHFAQRVLLREVR
jgi:ppGpp synthetase/RelA/SpoT-type nucleotidyltranferase